MKKQITGYLNIVKGSTRKTTGRVVRNKRMQAQGVILIATGKVQAARGQPQE